jgi:hypothetical protein
MRYFVPDICAAAEAAPETGAQDKLGGSPFGLRQDMWPTCTDCGKSQSLLAQLTHDPTHLDLGRAGRVLFAFQCNHNPGMCATWDARSGANACIIVELEELGHRLSDLPDDRPAVENEVRVLAWIEKDDGLPHTLLESAERGGECVSPPRRSLPILALPALMRRNPSRGTYSGWPFCAMHMRNCTTGMMLSLSEYLAPMALHSRRAVSRAASMRIGAGEPNGVTAPNVSRPDRGLAGAGDWAKAGAATSTPRAVAITMDFFIEPLQMNSGHKTPIHRGDRPHRRTRQ